MRKIIIASSLAVVGLYIGLAQVTTLPTLMGTLTKPVVNAGPLYTTRMNMGYGSSYTDGSGKVWAADPTSNNFFAVSDTILDANGVAVADQTIYRNVSWNNQMTYDFTVPNGTYTVKLKYAETYFTSSGQRVFNVYINGTQVLTDYDIFIAAGNRAFTARDEVFPNIVVLNGTISIMEQASVDDSLLAGVEITQTSGGGPGPTITSLKTLMPGGVCPAATTDVTTQLQAALTAQATSNTLVYDCMVSIAGNVASTGKTGITWDATAGGGVRFIGTPTAGTEQFKLVSCNGCTVKNLNIDVNQRQSYGFTSRSNTDLVFQLNTIRNVNPGVNSASIFRAGLRTKILDNTLVNLGPVFTVGSTSQLSALNTVGFWVGNTTEFESSPEIARNKTTTSGSSFIRFAGTNVRVHDNTATGLVAECIEATNSAD